MNIILITLFYGMGKIGLTQKLIISYHMIEINKTIAKIFETKRKLILVIL